MDIPEFMAKETAAAKNGVEDLVRFSISQRVEHMVLMVSFIVLAVTGLAQRFYTTGGAEWIILNLGGIASTRLIHRIAGYLLTASAVYHFAYLAYALGLRHVKPSMVPTLKDARDIVGQLRYSFGFSDKPAQFGRFDYHQKFEYWGIIFGGIVMIGTGFILAYPIPFTQVFPGEFLPAAKEFHRNEAMLAVLTVIIWHLYDTVFKPGIFPCDLSIFTGKISRHRMAEEHPLELAELASEGGKKARAAPSRESSSGSPPP